jgi:hypothetical protein
MGLMFRTNLWLSIRSSKRAARSNLNRSSSFSIFWMEWEMKVNCRRFVVETCPFVKARSRRGVKVFVFTEVRQFLDGKGSKRRERWHRIKGRR